MRAEESFERALSLLASCRRSRGKPTSGVSFAFYGDPSQLRIIEAQISVFRSARPDIFVKPFHIPSRYYTKLTVMIVSGEPPDIFLVPASAVPRLASKGALLPLGGWLKRSRKVSEADFHPLALKRMKFDGKNWGRGEIYALPTVRGLGPPCEARPPPCARGKERGVARLFLDPNFEVRPFPSSPSVLAERFLPVLREEVETSLAKRKGLSEAVRSAARRLRG